MQKSFGTFHRFRSRDTTAEPMFCGRPPSTFRGYVRPSTGKQQANSAKGGGQKRDVQVRSTILFTGG